MSRVEQRVAHLLSLGFDCIKIAALLDDDAALIRSISRQITMRQKREMEEQTSLEASGLSKSSCGVLLRAGYQTIGQLRGMTRKDLLRIKGCGAGKADEIIDVAMVHGVSIPDRRR